jgi:hypothetical protein
LTTQRPVTTADVPLQFVARAESRTDRPTKRADSDTCLGTTMVLKVAADQTIARRRRMSAAPETTHAERIHDADQIIALAGAPAAPWDRGDLHATGNYESRFVILVNR